MPGVCCARILGLALFMKTVVTVLIVNAVGLTVWENQTNWSCATLGVTAIKWRAMHCSRMQTGVWGKNCMR